MKIIELERGSPTLPELIEMAGREAVVLRNSNGAVFVFSQVDDFAVEAGLLRQNKEFMKWLRELGQEPAAISLGDLRKELGV